MLEMRRTASHHHENANACTAYSFNCLQNTCHDQPHPNKVRRSRKTFTGPRGPKNQAHPPELRELYDIIRPHQPEKTAPQSRPCPLPYFREIIQDNVDEISDSDQEEAVVVYEHFHHNEFKALRIMSDSTVQYAHHYVPKGFFCRSSMARRAEVRACRPR